MVHEFGPAPPRRSLKEFSIPEDPEDQVRHLMAVTEEQREELQRLQSSSEVAELRQKLLETQSELDQVYAKGEELHVAFEKKCDETAEFAGKAAFLSVEVERSKELEVQVETQKEQQAELERSYKSVMRTTQRTMNELAQRSHEWQRMLVEDCRSFAVRREASLCAKYVAREKNIFRMNSSGPAKVSPEHRPSCIPTPAMKKVSPKHIFETPSSFDTPAPRRSSAVGAENAPVNVSPPRQTKLEFDPTRPTFTPISRLEYSAPPRGFSDLPDSARKFADSARKLGLGCREPLTERRPRVAMGAGPRRVPIR